ncbi:MAG: hypothetical protein AB7S71_02985 [Dongiaceae bacterium]
MRAARNARVPDPPVAPMTTGKRAAIESSADPVLSDIKGALGRDRHIEQQQVPANAAIVRSCCLSYCSDWR